MNFKIFSLSICSIIHSFACKLGTVEYDGRYCALVHYHNPNSGTQSEYNLIITAEDNQLERIDFPQGYLTDEDLPSATFSSNGHTSFTLPNGYKYTINITGPENNCFDDLRKPIQCKGITQKGERCKKLTDNANGFCHHHKNQ